MNFKINMNMIPINHRYNYKIKYWSNKY